MHVPVLLQKVVDGLAVEDGNVVLDATLGRAGHARSLCQSAQNVRLIGLDADPEACQESEEILSDSQCAEVQIKQSHLSDIAETLDVLGVSRIDRALVDLGMSSPQIESSGRGFSFMKDEPLHMTFGDPSTATWTAQNIVNDWEAENIEAILRGYGEERFARRIAEAIVREREKERITTTFRLVEIIKAATPGWYHHKRIHPATRTFQALRIAVNNEIESLRTALHDIFDRLVPGGRIAVIAFHSIEDRVVKRYFRELKNEGKLAFVTPYPTKATEEEKRENPRARSAVLRIVTKQ